MKKQEFKVVVDDKEITLAIVPPDSEVIEKAETVYAVKWRESVESGLIMQAGVEQILRKGNLWNDTLQQERTEIAKALEDGEKKLLRGGIKLSEAKQIAIEMRINRNRLTQINSVWQEIQSNTAETRADNAKFNYFVSQCTVYADTGKKYFDSYEDYQSRRTNDVVSQEAAKTFGFMYYGLDANFQHGLPENKFLKTYGLCNEKLHLIDKQGHLVNANGQRVDEYGNLLNDKGEMVDDSGDAYTENGELKVDFKPFLDETEQPIVLAEEN